MSSAMVEAAAIWFIVIAAVLALLIGVGTEIETSGKSAPIPYGAFLDQLDAGNVASVSIRGTKLRGRFKHRLDGAQRDTFSTRVPDFGDPALIQEPREQHVAIDVSAPPLWTSMLTHIAWPMLVFLGVVLVAALVRLLRGGKASLGATASMPAHGMMGLLSGLPAKRDEAASPPAHDGDEPKSR